MTTSEHRASLSAQLCLFPFQETGLPEIHYIHDVSGSVLNFARIAQDLCADHDVIGLQCFGLDPDCPADRTVEEMAERYVEILLAQATARPYCLLGYSMGGLIAFEMAALLLERGAPIGLLGMIDPPVPGSIRTVSAAVSVRLLGRSMGVTSVASADSEDVDELLALLVADAGAAGILPASYTVEDLRPTVQLRLANAQAAARYRPARALPCDIHLLGANSAGLSNQVRGWEQFTHGQVHGSAIEADHVSLVGEENAPAVAGLIRGWLRRP